MHDTQSTQISQKQDGSNIYAIMKTMHPPVSHNDFVVYIYIYIYYILYILYIIIYIYDSQIMR